MEGSTIEALMRSDPHTSPFFQGVFAADTLPRRINKKPALLVVNTDPISKPGAHWQAIHIDEAGKGEFFCSYGLKPFVPNHRHFLDRVCKQWCYNTTSLQAADSSVCGHYCVLYLIHKAHGYSLRQFLDMYFSDNVEINDAIVKYMVERYKQDIVFCDDFVVCNNVQRCSKKRHR